MMLHIISNNFIAFKMFLSHACSEVRVNNVSNVVTADREACSRISIIDKRLITFSLQGNFCLCIFLNS